MLPIALTTLLQTVVLGSAPDNYANAYQAAINEGKPLVVLVGAEWCPACERMKNSVMPEVANSGSLQNVAYAYVNTDRQSRLSEQLLTGSMIPQLVVYVKTPEGWKRKQLVGAQSATTVSQLLDAASAPWVANVSQRSNQ